MLNKTKCLIAKALEYNIVEAAMECYNDAPADVNLSEIAETIESNAANFEEGHVLWELRTASSPEEALRLPRGIALAIKQCYEELHYHEAEGVVLEAVKAIKGQAILNILT